MPGLRTRIFVDFWNLQLSINERVGSDYRLDWKKLSPYLVAQAKAILGTPLQFEGINVYISYNPSTEKGKRLRNWSLNVLDRFPGIRTVLKERKAKSPPICPTCHQKIAICPHCNSTVLGTVEKGIDSSIVTDIISMAWAEAWDVALLVSSDHDFIPLVEFLNTKGLRIINVHFPPQGIHLARSCWASIDLFPHLDNLKRSDSG